ncbi:low molecular weight protein-tyrosine-phosphatase [Flavobacterium sp.]|jgi:protein-tyrosine phosphatase|uniref:low molecular weight protein-tyrosine-phosphatase n=1 Tax=Flavobacterium sp. TaxID=239 RepID=UPI0037C04059
MPVKILMVCLGNICRSPLAEGILRSKLDSNFIIDSAGTGGWHAGESPDQRSIETAKQNNIDISNQKARKFSIADFDSFDYIYVMDQSNHKDVINLAPNKVAKAKVALILGDSKEVPDPYYGGQEGFENVYYLLDQACEEIAINLSSKK